MSSVNGNKVEGWPLFQTTEADWHDAGESKKWDAPQWPPSPRRTKGVSDAPRRRSWGKILGRGRAVMAAFQTKYAEWRKKRRGGEGRDPDSARRGTPPWPLSQATHSNWHGAGELSRKKFSGG